MQVGSETPISELRAAETKSEGFCPLPLFYIVPQESHSQAFLGDWKLCPGIEYPITFCPDTAENDGGMQIADVQEVLCCKMRIY